MRSGNRNSSSGSNVHLSEQAHFHISVMRVTYCRNCPSFCPYQLSTPVTRCRAAELYTSVYICSCTYLNIHFNSVIWTVVFYKENSSVACRESRVQDQQVIRLFLLLTNLRFYTHFLMWRQNTITDSQHFHIKSHVKKDQGSGRRSLTQLDT